jgi:Xaa-Pro aminopeptidase
VAPLKHVLLAGCLLTPVAAVGKPSSDVYSERRARLADEIGGDPIVVPGAYLIRADQEKQDPDFWYLTGVESPYAILVLVGSGPPREDHLFLPDEHQFAGAQYPMDDERFRVAVWNRPVKRLAPGDTGDRATNMKTHRLDDFTGTLKDLIGDRKRLLFARDNRSLYAPSGLNPPLSTRQQLERAIADRLQNVRIEDVTPHIHRMGAIKDDFEIAALRRAAEIRMKGLIEVMRATRPGMNDREIAGLMEYVWKKEGSVGPSFGPIVASGTDAMTLFTLRAESYNAVDRVIKTGDLLFVDYGAAEHEMYSSDLCRTWPDSGRFTPDQKTYY